MRTVLITCILLFINQSFVLAQEKNKEEITDTNATSSKNEKIICPILDWPEYPGGRAALIQFLKNNVKYPKDAKKKQIQGRVVIGFTVKKDGSLSDFKVIKDVYVSLDKEAIRVAQLMPHWIPAENNGDVINSKFKIDIVFKIPQ